MSAPDFESKAREIVAYINQVPPSIRDALSQSTIHKALQEAYEQGRKDEREKTREERWHDHAERPV